MDKEEFVGIRRNLGKSQSQLARVLNISAKTVQSFEQGWRNIPAHINREMLLLLALKKAPDRKPQACWEIKKCPDEWKCNCIVWELQAKRFCWYFYGTSCQGIFATDWDIKIERCRECEIFQLIFTV